MEIVVNSPFVDFFLLFSSFFFPFFFALIITVEYRFRLLSRLFFLFLSFLTESLSLLKGNILYSLSNWILQFYPEKYVNRNRFNRDK